MYVCTCASCRVGAATSVPAHLVGLVLLRLSCTSCRVGAATSVPVHLVGLGAATSVPVHTYIL